MIAIAISLFVICVFSIYLNCRFYSAHTKLIKFFEDMFEIFSDDYRFFDALSKRHLLMNDPFVVELVRRVKAIRNRLEDYANKSKKINEEEDK